MQKLDEIVRYCWFMLYLFVIGIVSLSLHCTTFSVLCISAYYAHFLAHVLAFYLRSFVTIPDAGINAVIQARARASQCIHPPPPVLSYALVVNVPPSRAFGEMLFYWPVSCFSAAHLNSEAIHRS